MKNLFQAISLASVLLSGDRKFERSLPIIFDIIDERLPGKLGRVSSNEIEDIITSAIGSVTKAPVTPRQVKKVVTLYSPIEAASKFFSY